MFKGTHQYRGGGISLSAVYSASYAWETRQLKTWLRAAGETGLSSTEISLMVQKTCSTWVRAALLHLDDLLAKGDVVRREDRWVLAGVTGSGTGGIVGSSSQREPKLAQPESKVG